MSALANSFQENITRNLEAFKEHYPDVFELYREYSESRFHVVYDEQDNFNIFDAEKAENLYSSNPLASISQQLREYIDDPVYFSINYGASTELSARVNPVHTGYTYRIAKVGMLQSGLVKHDKTLPKRIKSFVCVSTGLGFDLQELALNRDIQNLYILEPEADLFYASMHFVRWDLILRRYAQEKDKKLFICIAEKKEIVPLFHEQFFKNGRFNANATYLYNSVYLEENEVILQNLKDEMASGILMGFGFYDDSRLSLAACIGNLRNKIPCFDRFKAKDYKIFNDVPVFVIGAGPSLDSDIEFIRVNQNKAIIISCGSGVKVLERANIVPDFHFECERTAFTQHWLDQVDHDYLKNIFFIGLNIIYPGVYDLFDEKGMVLKTFETGSAVMAQASVHVHGENHYPMFTNVNPTVVHMGVGITPILGFRKMYLFGTDMGYADPNKHHSDLSSYSDLKDEHKGNFNPNESHVFEVEANFEGEEIYTDRGYTTFRMQLEKILQHTSLYPHLEYYNCSNGAKIEGAIGVRSAELQFDKDIDKKSIVQYIKRTFFAEPCENEVLEEIESIVTSGKFQTWCSELEKYFSVEVSSQQEVDELIAGFVEKYYVSRDEIVDEDAYMLTVISGSLLYYFTMLVRITYYRTKNVDDNMKYVNLALKELVSFVRDVSKDFEDNYDKNDDISLYDLF